ncbi:MAG: cell division protein FtsL [Pseudomonadales bacterium]
MAQQSLMLRTVRWLTAWKQFSVVILVLIVVSSAIAVVYSAHMTRQMYAQLQVLQKKQDDLDSEYEKLLLEKSAWGDYARVDRVAREELEMKQPGSEDLVVVRH